MSIHPSRIPQLRMFTPNSAVMLTLYAYRIEPSGQVWYVQCDPNTGTPADSAEINVGPSMLANAVGVSYRPEEIDARVQAKIAELSLTDEDRASASARSKVLA